MFKEINGREDSSGGGHSRRFSSSLIEIGVRKI